MIERDLRSPESLPPAESMAIAMGFWLSEEIKSSMAGTNAYLDNMDTFIADGRAKATSHYGRLGLWTDQFAKDPTDMQAITMQIFGVQTGLSGAFRTQCYILAKSPGDYAHRRMNGPLGINIGEEVNDKLTMRFGMLPSETDLQLPSVNPTELAAKTKEVNMLRLSVHGKISDNPRHKEGMRAVSHSIRLVRLQKQWLRLGVDYMLHAAHINDGRLDKLEFLEPLPITVAKPYKPFAR